MRGFAIFIAIIVAIVILFFIGLSRVPDMLAETFSKKMGVPVSIDTMHFRLSKIEAKNFEIGNPKGFSLPKAFSAEEIEIDAPLTHFLKDEIIIDEVEVKDIYLGIEFETKTSTRGNWTQIFSTFQKNAGLDKTGGKKVLIKKLTFRNIRSEVLFRDSGGVQKLPVIGEIILTNVNTEGGLPMDQLTGSILGQMLREVFIRQNMGNLLQGILKSPGGAVDAFLKPFKGFFNTLDQEELRPVA